MSDNKKNKEYLEKVKKASPDSPILKNILSAFLSGGAVCLAGEYLFTLYGRLGAPEQTARTCVSITIIVMTAVLTAAGIYDKAAKHAGAGLAVPVSGFANSVASAAVEYSTEGRVLGTAVKMFTIAGPVIVYGCSTAVVYGFIYYFFISGAV